MTPSPDQSTADKLALVTGADGFIGSHLTEMLLERGHPVRALCQYNSFNSWGWLDHSEACHQAIDSGQLDVVTGDVRDPHCCKEITKGIDTVYHLAALIAIPYSYLAPDSYIDTNVKGTLNICQAAREHGTRRVLVTSTSEVYGTAQYVPIDEKHPLQPQSPYSASKIGADQIAMSFHLSFELPLVVARPFNTFGPRQSARAVIPTIITQIANGKKRIQLGDLTPTRDFNYVKDTCAGMIALANCDNAIGEVVNIGSNREISIGDTVKLIVDLMSDAGHEGVEIATDEQRIRPKNSEVFRLWCDNTRIRELTGFEPTFSLEDGMRQTIAWFSDAANLQRYKADLYNV